MVTGLIQLSELIKNCTKIHDNTVQKLKGVFTLGIISSHAPLK